MEIYASVAVNVMAEHEYLSTHRSFVRVKLRRILLKKGWLIRSLVFLTLRRVWCGNQFLQAKCLKVLCEIECEVAPFRVITGQQDCFSTEHIRVKFEIGVYLTLNIVILSVELIILGGFGRRQRFIGHDSDGDYGFAEKCRQHGKCGDSEIMLSAQPSGYLARTFTYLVGKLLLWKSALLHKCIDFIGYSERQVNFFLYFMWHLANHFPVSVSNILHSLNVLWVSIVLDGIVTVQSRCPSLNSSSNFCNVRTYPRNESSSSMCNGTLVTYRWLKPVLLRSYL